MMRRLAHPSSPLGASWSWIRLSTRDDTPQPHARHRSISARRPSAAERVLELRDGRSFKSAFKSRAASGSGERLAIIMRLEVAGPTCVQNLAPNRGSFTGAAGSRLLRTSAACVRLWVRGSGIDLRLTLAHNASSSAVIVDLLPLARSPRVTRIHTPHNPL